MTQKTRYVLYFDIEGSSKLHRNSLSQKSQAKQKIHEWFCEQISEFKPDKCPKECFRGDDGFAYFIDAINCVDAAIAIYNNRDILRTFCNDNCNIDLRMICFKDQIHGKTLNSYTGDAIENILPYERDFGAAGTVRLLSKNNEFYDELPTKLKQEFSKDNLIVDVLKGKKGDKYTIWQYPKLAYTVQRFGWSHISDRINEDLVSKMESMPDLILYSGSMGGSIIGGLAYSQLNKKFGKDCDVIVFGTKNINATNDSATEDGFSRIKNAANGKSLVLIIESTRKTGRTINKLKNSLKAVDKLHVIDYVFLYEDNKNFSWSYSSYPSRGRLIQEKNILFPWR